jgi:hypothetical protein
LPFAVRLTLADFFLLSFLKTSSFSRFKRTLNDLFVRRPRGPHHDVAVPAARRGAAEKKAARRGAAEKKAARGPVEMIDAIEGMFGFFSLETKV